MVSVPKTQLGPDEDFCTCIRTLSTSGTTAFWTITAQRSRSVPRWLAILFLVGMEVAQHQSSSGTRSVVMPIAASSPWILRYLQVGSLSQPEYRLDSPGGNGTPLAMVPVVRVQMADIRP